MRRWMTAGLALTAALLGAEPVILVNTLAERPVLMLRTDAGLVTRTVIPGDRVPIEAVSLSGLGEKDLPLSGGTVYYLARFGAVPSVYRLGTGQVLILNRSDRAVAVSVAGASAVLAPGTFVLAALEGGTLALGWDGADRPSILDRAGLYQFTGSPAALIPWE